MTIKTGQRESNMELCRLACMFYIVVFHLFIHNKEVTGGLYYTRALITLFSIGVPVFVLISGYFGIRRTVKGLLNIIAQVVYYCSIAVLVCLFVFRQSITTDNILSIIFPVTKTQYWFISSYILLYLLSPYLNRLLNNLGRSEFAGFIVTLTFSVCYWGGVMKGPNSGNRSILLFVFLYSIGRFIKLYYPNAESISVHFKKPGVVYFIVMIFFFLVEICSPTMIARGINWIVYPYNSIVLILFAILFFYSFKSMHIQNKWINYIAKSSFAIYLIHGQSIVSSHRWFYDIYSYVGLHIPNIHLKLLFLLVTALAICVLCILLDQVRIFIFKYAGIDKMIISIDEYVNTKTKLFNIVK